MNKTAACIKILQILGARNNYTSTKMLADILEINPRNIKEYIKELTVAGYTFETKLGMYGGYRLKSTSFLPQIKLSEQDKKSIQSGCDFLSNSKDFLKYDEYVQAMGKLLSSIDRNEHMPTPLTMIDRFPLAMDKNELERRYQVLNLAIDEQTKVAITYTGTNNREKKHILHPYRLFVYNGSWFVIGYNETINDFGYFKLNRIKEMTRLRERFSILSRYDEADYLDDFGMKQNGEYYRIRLMLTKLNTAMKERIYGKNQNIEEIDSEHIIFTCDMQNKAMIKSFVLAFGSKCRVLYPDWLIKDVMDEYWASLALYEENEND